MTSAQAAAYEVLFPMHCTADQKMGASVLHCYADYKWTGPSEPVAMLCRQLRRRGWRSELACKRPPGRPSSTLPERARHMGLTVHDDFYFDNRPNIRMNLDDVTRLRQLVQEGGFRIVHAHGSWDHVLAAMALGRTSRQVPLVRSDYGGREFARNPVQRLQFGPRMTEHLIVLSDRFRSLAVDRLKLDPRRVTTVPGAVDVELYSPRKAPAGIRERFGVAKGDVIFGVVSRVQRHRRFDVLLEAFEIVSRRDRHIKLVVLGRGTNREAILHRPVAEIGLRDTVFPLGYRSTDYREVLSMLDAGIMLVPGSDGSARAAMQMAAMGKPMIAAQRGVLPDIVADGRTGIVVWDTAPNLARAILEMAHSSERRVRWGQAARQRMVNHFSPDKQATKVEAVYEMLL